jgi:hypothetical protein
VSLVSHPDQCGAIGVFVERDRLGDLVPPALMSRTHRLRKAARPTFARISAASEKTDDVASIAAVEPREPFPEPSSASHKRQSCVR